MNSTDGTPGAQRGGIGPAGGARERIPSLKSPGRSERRYKSQHSQSTEEEKNVFLVFLSFSSKC